MEPWASNAESTSGKHWRWWLIAVLLGGLILGWVAGWRTLGVERRPTQTGAGASDVTLPLNPAAQRVTEADPAAAAPVVGALAPDFALATLDGDEVSLSQLRGRPVLINFWASWCSPCRLEMPALVRAYEVHQDEGFVILAINLTFQDALSAVQAFVQEFDMTFPVLLDETGAVTTDLYQLRGLPTSIFIDRDGRVVRMQIGVMTDEQVDAFVAEIVR